MNNTIKHKGIIDSVCQNHVTVRIVQSSACASCKVASRCNASESKEKLVDVWVPGGKQQWNVGTKVTVCAENKVVAKAMIYSFGMPFLLMFLTLIVSLQLGAAEWLSALLALAVLLPYYFILYLFRSRLGREIVFTIEE